ncbi:MAG: cob(I)yrinic acid a,c-diamide adenosyltransferase [Agathobacter sp.]|nr:cob(I)yrinic acid a,c-diamide adenosyltransferase [Agathobacter sp.]
MDNSLMHLYCGNGKGKTTAAVGLCIRAAGTGKRVLFSQFMKGQETGEVGILESVPNITVVRSKKEFPFYQNMTEEEKICLTNIHNEIIENIIESIDKKLLDIVVLDELTYPYNWNLINRDLVNNFISNYKGKVEIIITGRNPDKFMVDLADYITEMKCVRHPFDKGVVAREGIEY